MQWHRRAGRLTVRLTPGTAARTTTNRLFAVNYVDRMIRHRVKEHTRESIGLGRNATMQMHRMWIFAWDHNVRQPHRVNNTGCASRALKAGAAPRAVERLQTPPLRWRTAAVGRGLTVSKYVKVDLAFGHPQGQ